MVVTYLHHILALLQIRVLGISGKSIRYRLPVVLAFSFPSFLNKHSRQWLFDKTVSMGRIWCNYVGYYR